MLTFRKKQIPDVSRFWSLTAYTPETVELIENDEDKYAVASYTPKLKYNANGSVSIYIARKKPAGVRKANWLPVSDDQFNVMPKMFTEYDGGINRVPFSNHELLGQVRRIRGNRRAKIIYGDWGSTRPREPGGYGQRPIDRIDYPTSRHWYIARNREDEWDFEQAAEAIIASSAWTSNCPTGGYPSHSMG